MKRVRASLYGATAGAVVAMMLTALFAGRFALKALDVADGRSVIEASSGSMYLLVVIVGLLAGLIIGTVTYAFGAEAEAGSRRFPLSWMLPIGAVVSALFAYAVLRSGVGLAGDITAGVVTVSVARMVVIALIMGVVAGGITGAVVDALARPAFLGFEGEAAPESTAAMLGEMAQAVGAPLIAIVVGALFAVTLSQVLLAVEGTAAVAVFSIVGAMVLGGAALIALRPWDRGTPA